MCMKCLNGEMIPNVATVLDIFLALVTFPNEDIINFIWLIKIGF